MHPCIHAVLSHIKWYIPDQLDSFAVGIFPKFSPLLEELVLAKHPKHDVIIHLFSALCKRNRLFFLNIFRPALPVLVSIGYFQCQYKFFKQWGKLREYANSKGIQLIGDVPFYVGKDSVDTWMHPEQFLLDENGEAAYVAAAIPDKFSETGQVWGNPLYNWPLMQEDGFSWWKRRMQISTKLFDVIRMDHFIGFVKNYMVPKDATDASGGRWMKGPGRKLTDALNSVLNGTTVIADDYGGKALIPGVKKLLAKTGWLDTKVLMFAFYGDPSNEHLPHNYPGSHTVVYAGTHDNDTIVGYFRDKTEYELAYLYEYLNISSQEEIPDALIRCAYASIADIAVIQMQDLLKLGNEARMNAPSTVGYNWRWRLNKEQLAESRRAWIRNLAAVYRR